MGQGSHQAKMTFLRLVAYPKPSTAPDGRNETMENVVETLKAMSRRLTSKKALALEFFTWLNLGFLTNLSSQSLVSCENVPGRESPNESAKNSVVKTSMAKERWTVREENATMLTWVVYCQRPLGDHLFDLLPPLFSDSLPFSPLVPSLPSPAPTPFSAL